MPRKFKCPECDSEVIYEDESVDVEASVLGFVANPPSKTVYLKCPKGHWHSYTLTQLEE